MVVSADNPNLPWRAAFTPFYLLTILSAVMIWWMIYKKRSCEVSYTVLAVAVFTTTYSHHHAVCRKSIAAVICLITCYILSVLYRAYVHTVYM